MATSLAALRAVEALSGHRLVEFAAFVAGHSLGEYSALAAAGAFGVADAARLLRLRGQAMQEAVPVGRGGDGGAARRRAGGRARRWRRRPRPGRVCELANDNAAGQVVLSGDKAAVERAVEIAKSKGARRAVMLRCERALPLRADEAGGGGDAGGAGGGRGRTRRRCR